MFKNILLRIVALFSVSGLQTIGAGSLAGIKPIYAMGMGGLLAVSDVISDLAKAFLKDGKLTKDEVNDTFAKAFKKVEEKDKDKK